MRKRLLLALTCFALVGTVTAVAGAQPAASAQAATGAPSAGDDPIARYLYPPEAVLGHARELGLSDEQRRSIRGAVHEMQKRFLDLQFDLQERAETVGRLLQQSPVDETKVLAAVDQVLVIESQIKKAQLSLLIRIKNQLTSVQIAKLEAGLHGGAP